MGHDDPRARLQLPGKRDAGRDLPEVSRIAGAALLLLLALPGAGQADPITVRGLTFSDEMGGFTLLNAWGSGSLEDPITVVEEVTDTGGVVLVMRGLSPLAGNAIPTAHPAGFVLRKIVINATDDTWVFYDIEMQKLLGTPSDIYDGLSFGQNSQAGRPFVSDMFTESVALDEPRDAITYYGGVVPPGGKVSMTFVITSTGPVPEFYLLQRANRPIAMLPAAVPGG